MEISSNGNNSFRKLIEHSIMKFDYEVNSVKFLDIKGNSDDQVYFTEKSKNGKNYGI